MNKITILVVFLFCVGLAMPAMTESESLPAPASKLPALDPGKAWRLVWNDEFNGKEIDTSKWDVMGDSPRRDGFWTKSGSSLDGEGHLIIHTKKEDDRFISGAMRTKGKFEHTYGFWEARCQFPTQPGHWPAFWLMPVVGLPDGDGKGREGTEIDIMEKATLKSLMQHTLHWDGYGKNHKSDFREVKKEGMNDGFHTFALWWSPETYVFYVDGEETWRTSAGGVCQVPMYAKLTDEIGNWAGDIHEAKLPDRFVIDYVRVYDLVDAKKL